MSLMVPNEGKIVWASRKLYANAGAENINLRLFQNNVTPAETDTAATYTEATYTGYAAVVLTSSQSGGTWSVPTITSNLAISTYGANAVFQITGGSDQNVYGFFGTFASSGKCAFSQAFPAVIDMQQAVGTILTITPKLQEGHL